MSLLVIPAPFALRRPILFLDVLLNTLLEILHLSGKPLTRPAPDSVARSEFGIPFASPYMAVMPIFFNTGSREPVTLPEAPAGASPEPSRSFHIVERRHFPKDEFTIYWCAPRQWCRASPGVSASVYVSLTTGPRDGVSVHRELPRPSVSRLGHGLLWT